MGLVIGVLMGFFGIGLLIIPLIIDIYQSRKKDNEKYKRYLEGSTGLIVIGMIFMIGGLVLVGFISTWGLAKTGYSGLTGGFEGSSGKSKGSGKEEGGNDNALLTYMLLKDKEGGGGAEAAEGAEATEGAEAAEGAEGLGLAEEAAEFAV